MNLQEISKMLQSLLSKLKEITFKSEVQNLPEVQKVEVTNPPAEVVIPEFPKVEIPEVKFDSVIKAIENKVIPLDDTATKKQLLNELQAIKKALIEPEDKDEGYDIENGVERLIGAVLSLRKEDKELDLSPIIDAIKKIDTTIDWTPLTDLTKNGEVQVKINSKQIETLTKALSKSIGIAVGGGGNLRFAGGDVSSSNPLPVSASIDTTGLATSAKQDALLTELQLKADLTETQPISAASLPLPTGAATAANQQTDALTDTELRATPVPISGTVTAEADGVLDANNSSTDTLAGGATFTGTGTEVLKYSYITISVITDQVSATDGLKLQFSSDNSNWDYSEEHTIEANVQHNLGMPVIGRYFRVVYTNGATVQGAFRLQTILKYRNIGGQLERLDGDVQDNHIVQSVRSVLTARKPDGTYANIESTAGGNLKVAVEEISDGLDIGAGNAGTETQRVSISTDDVNLSAIKTAVETLDNIVSGSEAQVDVVSSALPTGASTFAEQQTQTGHLATIAGDTTSLDGKDFATSAKQDTTNTHLSNIDAGKLEEATFTGRIGEVQASPTANTVLDRLKTIADNQLADGHNVTIDNSTGASAVNIQDGGNSITVDNGGTFATQPTYTASTPYHLVSAATTNATSVKGSAGVVYGIYASNVNAAARYLKLYNKASAPTVGTDTPVHTFIIPGNTAGAGTNIPIPVRGINFSTGIAFALTTEATDAGTTAVAANEIVVNIDYI